MNKYIKVFLLVVILIAVAVFSYNIGLKKTRLLQNSSINNQIDSLDPSSEEGKSYWKTYSNKELGISFLIPKSCGEPEMNEYYKNYPESKTIIQAVFPQGCPIHILAAAKPETLFSGGTEDTSFKHYQSKIKESEFNTETHKKLKGIIEYAGFWTEYGTANPNNVTFRFNLKSSDYLVVSFNGNIDFNFRTIIDSIEIK